MVLAASSNPPHIPHSRTTPSNLLSPCHGQSTEYSSQRGHSLLTQNSLEDLTARRLRNEVAKADLAVHDLVSGQRLQEVRLDCIDSNIAFSLAYNVCARDFRSLLRAWDANHGRVDNVGMCEQAAFKFTRRNLPTTNFDQLLSYCQ